MTSTEKHGNGAGKKSDNFAELIKDKCSNLKEDNISVNDAIEDLNDHFINEGDKLSDTEKTALNVITLLLLPAPLPCLLCPLTGMVKKQVQNLQCYTH
jgi:hypothetical protein